MFANSLSFVTLNAIASINYFSYVTVQEMLLSVTLQLYTPIVSK
jgi:hypothetical protein